VSAKERLRFGVALVVLLWLLMGAWIAMDLQQTHSRDLFVAERVAGTLTRVLEGHLEALSQKMDLRLSEFASRFQQDIAAGSGDAAIQANLSQSLALFPEAHSFRVADAQGNYLFDATGRLANVNIADRSYFRTLRDQPGVGLVVSEPMESRVTGDWVIVYARRLEDSQGRFLGVVLAAVRSNFFEQFFETLHLGEGSVIALWGSDMELVARWPQLPRKLGQRLGDSPILDALAAGRTEGSFRRAGALDGVERLFYFRQLQGVPFVVSVGQADVQVLAEWRQRVKVYAFLGAVITLAMVLLVRVWTLRYRHALSLAEQMTQAVKAKSREGRALLDSIPDPAWLLDTDGRYLAVNEAFCRYKGQSMEEVVGHTVDELFPPDEAERLRQGQQEVYARGGPVRQEVWLDLGRDLGRRPFEFLRVPVCDEQGQPRGLAGVAWDMSERFEAEARQRLITQVFDHSTEALLILDGRMEAVAINRAFTEFTGYQLEDVLGHMPREFAAPRHDGAFFDMIRERLAEQGSWSGEAWVRCKNGLERPLECRATPIVNGDQVVNWTVFMRDLSERKAAEARIDTLTNMDPLTDLPNRSSFTRYLEDWLAAGGAGALLVLDLDQLSRVNDAYGHAAGDKLLRRMGGRLRRLLRERDVIGRLGDDQFGILFGFSGVDLHGVESVTRKLLEAVARPILIEGHHVVCTACVGICLVPRDGKEAALLLRNADAAMHDAKNAGQNSYRCFSEDMNQRLTERLRLESDLRGALERRELRLHYQPQVEIRNGHIVGFESLLRWAHPELGLISPLAFIPLAEETRLILPIGDWVLEESCRQNRAWQDQGLPPMVVAVNISAVQFQGDILVDSVARALERSGLEARWLELEITESVLMQEPEQAAATLVRLKALGVRLSIDDFGTGYSSLAYLKRFPIDKIKIDRSFIRDLCHDPDDAAIVRMVLGMARELQRTVIAEGVESEAQLGFLLAHQCHEYQGFLCSPPVPAAQVPALLQRLS